MKLAVFSVCMPEFEPMDAADKLAALGYDGVVWRVTTDKGDRAKPSFWSGNRTSMTAQELIQNAPALKAKTKALGLAMPSIGSYIDAHDLAAVELHMKAAAAVGAKALRVGPGKYDPKTGGYQQGLARAREQYARVADLAARHGVRAMIETHMGLITPSVFKAMAVLDGLHPQHVGIIWDPGNQTVEGGEVYRMAIEIAGDYLGEVHIKNARFEPAGADRGQTTWKPIWCSVHKGLVNWPAIVELLKQAGYDGWLVFEDFSTEVPLEQRLADNIRWFRTLL